MFWDKLKIIWVVLVAPALLLKTRRQYRCWQMKSTTAALWGTLIALCTLIAVIIYMSGTNLLTSYRDEMLIFTNTLFTLYDLLQVRRWWQMEPTKAASLGALMVLLSLITLIVFMSVCGCRGRPCTSVWHLRHTHVKWHVEWVTTRFI